MAEMVVNLVDKKKKNLILTFLMGVISAIFVLPLLSALGVPSFDTVLNSLFGEGSIWAIVFSLMLILLTIFCVGKTIKNNS